MKGLRKGSFLLVIALVLSLFSGCTKEDKDLLDAFLKNQEILSVESTTDLSFALSSTGLSKEEQVVFDSVANLLNDLKVTMKQKSQANKEQTMVMGQVDVNAKFSDMGFDSTIWVDIDLNSETPVFKEIFKLPLLLTASLPEPMTGKEYFVLDFETMNQTYEELEIPVDYNKTMAIAMKYQEKFMNVFKEYAKKMDSKLSNVTKLGDKVIEGQLCSIYQMKFDDASFKQLLKYSVISLLEDEEIIPLFKEYMTEIMTSYDEEITDEMDFTKDLPELITKVKEFFEKFEECKILGKDGIIINYGVNKDGFIISEEGTFDFLIDTKEILELVSTLLDEEQALPITSTAVFNFTISYNTILTSINKDIEVALPTITEENSIDFGTLMSTMMPEDEPSAIIFVEDTYLNLTKKPLFRNNQVYIPTRDISEALGAQVEWNQGTKEITITKDDIKLIFTVNSNKITKNGEQAILDSKIIVEDGTAFVPLRFISENLGFTINWDSLGRMITINK